LNYKRLFFYLAILLIAAAVWYGIEYSKRKEAERKERFVNVYAGIATVTEIYRDHPGLMARARDSIFYLYRFNADSMKTFREEFEGQEEKWTLIWDDIRIRVDSLANIYLNNMPQLPENSPDTDSTSLGDGA
jgi:hypothetical protein